MDRELTPEEIAELLPAYALDAVDDDERARDRGRTWRAPTTRATRSTEFQVAASMLAHAGGPPPEGVWEKLESIITESPRTPADRRAPRRRRARVAHRPRRPSTASRRWQWFAAAAAVVALAFGGLWLVERSGDGSAVADTAALARTAATAPGRPSRGAHRRRRQHAGHRGRDPRRQRLPHVGAATGRRRVRPTSCGASRRTGTISLGVLGREPKTVAFKAAAPTQSLAITTEVAGGVPVSRNAPDAVGDVA